MLTFFGKTVDENEIIRENVRGEVRVFPAVR